MNLEDFNAHGWKATDKVVLEGQICPVILVDFESAEVCITFNKDGKQLDRWRKPEQIELYQPIHESHTTQLLTNLE